MLACSVAQSYPTLCDYMDCSLPGSSVHGIFSGKNTGEGYHFLLQTIFPTQESKQHLLYLLLWWADSLPLNHLGVSDRKGTSDNSVTLGTDFVAMGNKAINEHQKSVHW